MTAKAINDGHDNYTIGCRDCPVFEAVATGQKPTVAIMAAHDKRFHPVPFTSARQWPSVRDVPRVGAVPGTDALAP